MSKKRYDLSNPRCLEKIMKLLVADDEVDLKENEELGAVFPNFSEGSSENKSEMD